MNNNVDPIKFIVRALRKVPDGVGLRAFHLLLFLRDKEEGATMADIARGLGITTAAVTVLVCPRCGSRKKIT